MVFVKLTDEAWKGDASKQALKQPPEKVRQGVLGAVQGLKLLKLDEVSIGGTFNKWRTHNWIDLFTSSTLIRVTLETQTTRLDVSNSLDHFIASI